MHLKITIMETDYALFKVRLMIVVLQIAIVRVDHAQFIFITNSDETLTVMGYSGTNTPKVSIPDTTNGLPITGIGNYAFYYSGLTKVVIGANVTSIGDYAFCASFNLTNVIIGNNVTSIGFVAFSECLSLASVTIGNNVTNIGEAAFFGCGLTSVTIPKKRYSPWD